MLQLFLAAALIAQSPETPPQEQPAGSSRTIESAQTFLSTVLARGTTKIAMYPQDGSRWTPTLLRVTYSGCSTALNYSRARIIDWGLVSSVETSIFGRVIFIRGSIKTEDGVTVNDVELELESGPMRDRVSNAMNFLKEKCDRTNGSPF
jgi:hypothetical protein